MKTKPSLTRIFKILKSISRLKKKKNLLIPCLKSSPMTLSVYYTKYLQTPFCLFLGFPNLGLHAQSLTLSKFSEWCGFTALCLCPIPSSPPRMSFKSVWKHLLMFQNQGQASSLTRAMFPSGLHTALSLDTHRLTK